MAHWFHRNPLKATASVNFDLKGAATNGVTQKICSDLKQKRIKLLDLLANPNVSVDVMEKESSGYFSLLQGFIQACDEKGGDSKLRHAVRYRWTNTLLGQTPTECFDTYYEVISMCINLALWFTKHSAMIAGSKEEPTMEEAKEVHSCLRKATGIFQLVKDSLISRLLDTHEKGADTDPRVLEAYIHQTTAEAQEVTIARAIELKHNNNLVSALAYETAKMFADSDHSLAVLDTSPAIDKWRKYVQLKSAFYTSMAYSYYGHSLLDQDKCGEAIKCLHESVKCYEKAGGLGLEYSKVKGPGPSAKPHQHLFFRTLGPVVKRTLEKCERENGFIYYQKVPEALPDLELKATYGLVSPEEYSVPSADPVWTKQVYDAFNIAPKDPETQKAGKAALKAEGDLPPVKETDVNQSDKDPKNKSGCVIS